ncbi:MAG TPA: glycoside hydrolase family 16 protein [Bryobacteraceae bacterium]|jgi:beta-glucanase (GH16 family)|nr:glycoside hydrolase family 16 protein [Bryobacteraceae bacterium]
MTCRIWWIALAATALAGAQPPRWQLVWSDEFNQEAHAPPDPTKWTYDRGGGGWGNQELEVYTDSAENVFQDGQGHLVIRALKAGSGFTSARIKTQNLFTVVYGRVEARIKIPSGQGIWPAFWMLGADITSVGWPACGEIDIMENIGKEPAIVHGTVHGPGYSGANGISAAFQSPSGAAFSDDFHVFSIVWEQDSIQFFVDNTLYHRVRPADLPPGAKWVYEHPFFILLNVAVGGKWPGNPDSTTRFPQSMLVDWVRVSRLAAATDRPGMPHRHR